MSEKNLESRSRRNPSAPRRRPAANARMGNPEGAPRRAPARPFATRSIDTPEPGPNEVLVLSMAAGVNYNGVWAGLGKPVSVLDVHKQPFHIAGSDCAGIVWKIGSAVTRWKVGDEVVLHCNMTCGECPACNGYDPMGCENQRIWGYETPYGSFAQFTLAQAQQLMPKSANMTVGRVARATRSISAPRTGCSSIAPTSGRARPSSSGAAPAASARSPVRSRECSARPRSPWYRAPRRRRWPGSSERWGR